MRKYLWFVGVLAFLLVGCSTVDESITGVSTLAISRAELSSSSPYFSWSQVWIVTFAGNPLGQSFYGSFSPGDVQAVSPGDVTTKNTFTVSVEYMSTICKYALSGGASDPIKDVKTIEWFRS